MLDVILALLLTPLVWRLSLRYFDFIYLDGLVREKWMQMIECFVLALVVIPLVWRLFWGLLFGAGSLLMFALHLAILAAVLVLVVAVIRKFIGK